MICMRNSFELFVHVILESWGIEDDGLEVLGRPVSPLFEAPDVYSAGKRTSFGNEFFSMHFNQNTCTHQDCVPSQ